MINGKSVLAVIPARGGSKGLPGKNILTLAGKPLIAWTIEAAAKSVLVDRLLVSTDDAQIAAVAKSCGAEVPFTRPQGLATDDAPLAPVLLHAVEAAGGNHDYVVLLQPTSPLRLGSDIDGAIELCHGNAAPACVSISASPKAYWTYTMDASGVLEPLFPNAGNRRQDLPAVYQPNGAVYVADWQFFKDVRDFYTPKTMGYIMPPERSIDIDTMQDFLLAEALLSVSRA